MLQKVSGLQFQQSKPLKTYAMTTCELGFQHAFSSNQPTARVLVTHFCHIICCGNQFVGRSHSGKKDSRRIAIKMNFWLNATESCF